MKNKEINWNSIPDVITKDQLYRICHIGKSTALYLLQSGLIPCEYTGKRTRCYKIKKEDVIAYLKNRKEFPEIYSVPSGWYSCGYLPSTQSDDPCEVQEDMREYYEGILSAYPDVMKSEDVVKLTGYVKTTVNNWCFKGHLKSFKKNGSNRIPKVCLIEFLASPYFQSITRKSKWHVYTIHEISRRIKFRKSRNSEGVK